MPEHSIFRARGFLNLGYDECLITPSLDRADKCIQPFSAAHASSRQRGYGKI